MEARMTAALKRALVPVTAIVLLLMLPAVAGAAVKSVDMGVPRASQRAFQPLASDVNDFFPHQVTINVGDTVRFVPSGFHTVDLPGSRTQRLPLFTPGAPIAGSLDALGAPFWFNGQPSLGFNPTLLAQGFGKRFAYTGARAVLSGLPVARRPRPMQVRFTRAGSFRYFCDVHLGMTGRVVVRPAGRRVPSVAADRAAVRAQVAAGLRIARTLPQAASAANTIDVGREGRGRVSYFGFVPRALTVPVGTTVTFRMPARTEVHTASTGPGDPENQPSSYLGQITASLDGPAPDPKALYPSDLPGAPASISPVFHGNGFWSSGAMDLDPSTQPPPGNAVRFAAPGVYQIYCLIHPFMHGTITVQ
jgi:plastocyanin